MTKNIDTARAAWGDEIPGWVVILAEACDRTSGRKVSAQIRYSAGLVSQVLSRKYTGSYSAVEGAVKGAFMNAKVECPVLGEMAKHVCLENQRQPFINSNPTRVRLWKACNGACTNSQIAHRAKEMS